MWGAYGTNYAIAQDAYWLNIRVLKTKSIDGACGKILNGPTSAKTRLRVKIIFLRKMMFCKKVVSRRRSSAVKWNQRESRLFEEVARSWQEGFQQSGKSKGFRKPSGRIFTATPLVTTKSF